MPRLLFGRNQSHAAPAPRFGLKLKCYPSRAHVCRRALGYARLHRAKQAQGWLPGRRRTALGTWGTERRSGDTGEMRTFIAVAGPGHPASRTAPGSDVCNFFTAAAPGVVTRKLRRSDHGTSHLGVGAIPLAAITAGEGDRPSPERRSGDAAALNRDRTGGPTRSDVSMIWATELFAGRRSSEKNSHLRARRGPVCRKPAPASERTRFTISDIPRSRFRSPRPQCSSQCSPR
jgi:hypothetical protein